MNSNTEQSIVVAGIPRSGTTMMFRALAGLPKGSTKPKEYDGAIFKTHSKTPSVLQNVDKAIFLFGDPVASVISTRLNRWGKGHFANCGEPELDPETADIFGSDILGYETMFDAWFKRQSFDLACVRYEAVYQNLLILNSFFGQHLFLPPYRQRRTNIFDAVSELEQNTIRTSYHTLIDKVEKAPDVTIFLKA